MEQTSGRAAHVASIVVRPVPYEERARWRQLMNGHHYLGFRPLVGQSLCYVATYEEQWVALLGWGAAALKCAAREAWIGWTPSLKFPRLYLFANNVRFLILPHWHQGDPSHAGREPSSLGGPRRIDRDAANPGGSAQSARGTPSLGNRGGD